jgi:glutathione peroxidase-family protein
VNHGQQEEQDVTDIRQCLASTTGALADLAEQAAYVAIGVGVLEFQKAQVRRQSLGSARERVAKRVKDFDATVAQAVKVVDSTLEPVWQQLPEPAQAVIRQARQARDELRARVFGFST